jgi:hypothetical protein
MLAHRLGIAGTGLFLFAAVMGLTGSAGAQPVNLAKNPDFRQRTADGRAPADYQITGDVEYRYLGDPKRDIAGWGVALESAQHAGRVWQTVIGIDPSAGRWYRFTFRGLPQSNFAVAGGKLEMAVEYFGDSGRTSFDGKSKPIDALIEQDRRDLSVNGDHRVNGAAVWRTYQLDFWLPFPQVNSVRMSVSFQDGRATTPKDSEFFVTDFSLTRLADAPADPVPAATQLTLDAAAQRPRISLGGRWFYQLKPGETQAPAAITAANADQLLYHDAHWQAPFAGSMSTWLRAGDKDSSGQIATQDVFVPDNVTLGLDANALIVHTKGLPNHPTGKFPQPGFGPQSNPNYIQEHLRTYYIPLNPKVNPRHIFTTTDNSNHALPMGPIGLALNGVVFFNPFDANSQDASNMMDNCCGHPSPDNTYHYHKYPICMNSPWADDGNEHSPLIGFAFDGFPIYGPFESAGVMAKDITGPNALNDFNLHWDADRGWHYHATPGKFPYIIGGYWGTEDARDKMSGRRGRGPGMGPGMGPPGWPPPPPPDGFGPPP